MFSTKKPAPKKPRSWETVDEDDDQAPSETFLKLQKELKERERLAQEKEEELAAAAAAAATAAAEAAASQEIGSQVENNTDGETAGDSAVAADADVPAQTTVEVEDYNPRTRIHDLKAHFHQFGDVVEVALLGKKVMMRPLLLQFPTEPVSSSFNSRRSLFNQALLSFCVICLMKPF